MGNWVERTRGKAVAGDQVRWRLVEQAVPHLVWINPE